MTTQKIVIELFPDSLCREFHVPVQIATELVYGGGFMGGNRNAPFLATFSVVTRVECEPSEQTRATVMRFYDIPGVYAVGTSGTTVRIERDDDVDWNHIEGDIIDALKEVMMWKGDVSIEYLYDNVSCSREAIEVLRLITNRGE